MYGLKHQKEKRSMDHFAGLDVSGGFVANVADGSFASSGTDYKRIAHPLGPKSGRQIGLAKARRLHLL